MAKKRPLRQRKYSRELAAVRLINAVGDWVNAAGGNALVAGDIGIMDYPGDPEFCFRVVIKVTGHKPIQELGEGHHG